MKIKRNISKVIITIIIVLALMVGAYAAILHFASKSETSPFIKGEIFELDLSSGFTAAELLPGDSVDVNPVITNDATSEMYVFIEVDTPVVGVDSIYEYDAGDGWTLVESSEGKEVYAYASGDSMTTLAIEESTDALTSQLTLSENLSNAEFAGIDDINVTIIGYAVGTEESPTNPAEAWTYCKQLGGIE